MRRSAPRGAGWAGFGEAAAALAQDRARGAGGDAGEDEAAEDWCTLNGALALARRIERHWRDEGLACRCRVLPGGFGVFVVRSNIALVPPSHRRAGASNSPGPPARVLP